MHGVPVELTHLGAGFQGLKRGPICLTGMCGPVGAARTARTLSRMTGCLDPFPTTTRMPKRGAKTPIGPFGCSRLPDSDPTNAAWIGRGPVVTADGFEAMTVP